MAVTTAITSAVLAAGGTAYSAVQSNKARKDAQGAADLQAKEQQANIDREKAQKDAAQDAQQVGVVANQNRADAQKAGGYNSTISTSPTGLSGITNTNGNKTLLGS